MAAVKSAIKPKRKSKFSNVRTTTPDGFTHASKKEAARWLFLLDQQADGVIRDLRRQTRWPLLVNGIKIGTYIDDFNYIVNETDLFVVEDTKSPATARMPIFRRSKAHLRAQYGLEIVEVYRANAAV